MSFSSSLQNVANKLLTNYGQTVSVSRPNVVFLDPTTGIATETAPTNFSGVGHPSVYNIAFVNNTTIFNTDIKLSFYSATTPQAGDIFTIGTITYTAISVNKSTAQGNDIYYIVQLRQ